MPGAYDPGSPTNRIVWRIRAPCQPYWLRISVVEVIRSGRWLVSVVAAGTGAALALGVAAAWIPVRAQQPNVLVALALVIVVALTGSLARRSAVVATALCAGLAFTYFDTEPYERFVISSQPDIETAVALVFVGLFTGELALRVARQRYADRSASGDMDRVRAASSQLALGEELVVMIGAVAAQLTTILGLVDCWYSTEPIAPGTAVIDREGHLSPGSTAQVALPVWGLGQVLGHFLLRPPNPALFGRHEHLLVAVTLADQVGAALAAQAPPPPPDPGDDDEPTPHLRLIR